MRVVVAAAAPVFRRKDLRVQRSMVCKPASPVMGGQVWRMGGPGEGDRLGESGVPERRRSRGRVRNGNEGWVRKVPDTRLQEGLLRGASSSPGVDRHGPGRGFRVGQLFPQQQGELK